MVSAKKQKLAKEVVAGLLRDGESVVHVGAAGVGQVSVKRQTAVAATSAVLSAGMLTVVVRPKGFYLVVTEQRLLLLELTPGLGHPMLPVDAAPIEVALPLRMRRAKGGAMARWDLLDNTERALCTINIPWATHRRSGSALQAALDPPSRAVT